MEEAQSTGEPVKSHAPPELQVPLRMPLELQPILLPVKACPFGSLGFWYVYTLLGEYPDIKQDSWALLCEDISRDIREGREEHTAGAFDRIERLLTVALETPRFFVEDSDDDEDDALCESCQVVHDAMVERCDVCSGRTVDLTVNVPSSPCSVATPMTNDEEVVFSGPVRIEDSKRAENMIADLYGVRM
jgi:hypothetical protein